MPLPEAVNDDTAGERVFGINNPAGKGTSTFSLRSFVGSQVRRERVHPANGSGCDFVLWGLRVAAPEHLDWGWFLWKYTIEFGGFTQGGEFLFLLYFP